MKELRKLRRIKSHNGKYSEYIINIPKSWVESISKKDAIKPIELWFDVRGNEKLELIPLKCGAKK